MIPSNASSQRMGREKTTPLEVPSKGEAGSQRMDLSNLIPATSSGRDFEQHFMGRTPGLFTTATTYLPAFHLTDFKILRQDAFTPGKPNAAGVGSSVRHQRRVRRRDP